jgi:DNA invertase Pin-like site-specific DNA recombinase
MAHSGKFIAYFRVSTKRQGRSGLGLEAQRDAVVNYLNGGNWQLVAEFTEIETGKRADRPEFAKALAAARLHRATLVIAKLDRLSRNVHFVTSLKESGVDFVCADMPDANKLTIHIMAAMAEHEAEMISTRTKQALARSKKKLGGFRGVMPTARTRKASAAALQKRSAERAADLSPIIKELQAAGATSLRNIAAGLNARGIPTSRGDGEWSAVQVARVLERIEGPFVEASAA